VAVETLLAVFDVSGSLQHIICFTQSGWRSNSIGLLMQAVVGPDQDIMPLAAGNRQWGN